jgi:hypothetical protein
LESARLLTPEPRNDSTTDAFATPGRRDGEFDGTFSAVNTQKVTKDIDDEETIQHVADALEAKYPGMARVELEAIVREEFGAIAGRPVRDYLSILTERAARKRIKKSIASA